MSARDDYLDLLAAVGVCLSARIPVLLWGDPGEGKTAALRRVLLSNGSRAAIFVARILPYTLNGPVISGVVLFLAGAVLGLCAPGSSVVPLVVALLGASLSSASFGPILGAVGLRLREDVANHERLGRAAPVVDMDKCARPGPARLDAPRRRRAPDDACGSRGALCGRGSCWRSCRPRTGRGTARRSRLRWYRLVPPARLRVGGPSEASLTTM